MDTCWRDDQTGEAATGSPPADKTCACACGNVKNVIAEKLHKVAAAVGERAASQEAQPALAQYGKQAAEILDQSADYIQDFDYEKADAQVRECVRRNPGLSLVIAGVSGLIIGALFRRR